jgi:hypothetical protein
LMRSRIFVSLRLVVQMIDCGVTFISFQRVLGSIWLLIFERATFSFFKSRAHQHGSRTKGGSWLRKKAAV